VIGAAPPALQALALLIAEGPLESVHGRGTFGPRSAPSAQGSRTALRTGRPAGRFDATCPACALIIAVDEQGRAIRHLRGGPGYLRTTFCTGRGRELFAHDRTSLQRAELLDADSRAMSEASIVASGGDRFPVATVVLPDGTRVAVDHQRETAHGAELDRALTAAGCRPGYGWIAYDNLIDDGAALMVRPLTD
jgi:hypothetical protein